jgi:hypothetical protein
MIEWELDERMQRTGRWRKRQYYANVGDTRVPSRRVPAEWRGKPEGWVPA